jgi:hypothetical protein
LELSVKTRIDPHTIAQANRRGVSEAEIEEVLQTGTQTPAKMGRWSRSKVFVFESHWKGHYYPQKRVEVIYTLEECVIITVTVYSYYGEWRVEP